jgi:hypothetical protein
VHLASDMLFLNQLQTGNNSPTLNCPNEKRPREWTAATNTTLTPNFFNERASQKFPNTHIEPGIKWISVSF